MLTTRQIERLAEAVEEAVTVDGRGLRVPTVRLEVLDGELCLRIDDEARPDSWAAVRLPSCAVLAMAELVGLDGASEDTFAPEVDDAFAPEDGRRP